MGKKANLKPGRLLLGKVKNQRGGCLRSIFAALAPIAINGLTKIFGGGRKKDTLTELLLKDLNNCQKGGKNDV